MDEVRGVIWTNFDPKNNRAKVTAFMGPFFLINILILLGALTPFQQWCAVPLKVLAWRGLTCCVHRYAFGKLSPTCDCCNWYMAANSTERDNYVGGCSRYMVNRGKVPPALRW